MKKIIFYYLGIILGIFIINNTYCIPQTIALANPDYVNNPNTSWSNNINTNSWITFNASSNRGSNAILLGINNANNNEPCYSDSFNYYSNSSKNCFGKGNMSSWQLDENDIKLDINSYYATHRGFTAYSLNTSNTRDQYVNFVLDYNKTQNFEQGDRVELAFTLVLHISTLQQPYDIDYYKSLFSKNNYSFYMANYSSGNSIDDGQITVYDPANNNWTNPYHVFANDTEVKTDYYYSSEGITWCFSTNGNCSSSWDTYGLVYIRFSLIFDWQTTFNNKNRVHFLLYNQDFNEEYNKFFANQALNVIHSVYLPLLQPTKINPLDNNLFYDKQIEMLNLTEKNSSYIISGIPTTGGTNIYIKGCKYLDGDYLRTYNGVNSSIFKYDGGNEFNSQKLIGGNPIKWDAYDYTEQETFAMIPYNDNIPIIFLLSSNVYYEPSKIKEKDKSLWTWIKSLFTNNENSTSSGGGYSKKAGTGYRDNLEKTLPNYEITYCDFRIPKGVEMNQITYNYDNNDYVTSVSSRYFNNTSESWETFESHENIESENIGDFTWQDVDISLLNTIFENYNTNNYSIITKIVSMSVITIIVLIILRRFNS